ncbi:cation efflux protein, CzcI-like [Acinetobacter sp. NIPH 2699]|uniref:cation efflux protein, CzcI-like n=1 Tax=Acinetobacter sp. NIPH 2699 TaxID=2923433 RepID=UPI001F4A8E19|nr:cation efflux protein, CzcI-like [Acinetobacter sp. NIPH 2699]MCH7335799.1 cation transporter [Acinetobacter sp. NIPH 2699]
MTLLLSLFIFQSIWNVAAAYCSHETISKPTIAVTHFGHHLLESSKDQVSSFTATEETVDIFKPLNLQDHHDHLPSCFHVVVISTQQQLDEPIFQTQKLEQKYYWSNFYQSPYLSGLNPPPVFTSLSVG